MSDQRLLGKVAVITGGGSGIGRASALLCAKHGARVALLDRDREHTEETKRWIEQAGGEALVFDCDIAKPEQVENSYAQTVKQWGRLDIVFANAGINGTLAPIETMEIADWDETMNVNLRGTFATIKYAIPHLKDKGGSIIITSSINGNRVFSSAGYSVYSTTKAGEVALMKMAALELAQYKIRVNAICPGAIKTNIGESSHPTADLKEIEVPLKFPEGSHPLEGRAGEPEHVANVMLFLASDDASHVTGTKIYVDGAESLLRG